VPSSPSIPANSSPIDVLVAGGGVAGLSCAAALADAGLKVTVFESDGRLGGRACSWKDEVSGDTVDIGPHVLSNEHRTFNALLERLGTAAKVQWQPDPFVTLLDQGRHLRIASKAWLPPMQGLPNLPSTLSAVSPLDVLSNWRVAWQATRLSESRILALDTEDALGYLRRMGVSPRVMAWFWTPTVLALLNVPLERCSAAAMMRVFRLMLGRSGYHFGFPRIGLADLFAPGCQRLVERAGGSVRLATAVQQVIVRDGRFAGFMLAGGERVEAPCGVLAVTPQVLAQVCNSVSALQALSSKARHFEPCPYVSTYLWFDRKITTERFWARVWRPGDLNTDFYDLSNIREGGDTANSLIASNGIHAHEAWHWDDDRIVEQTRREVAQFEPAADRAELRHARVHRIPMAIHCPVPGSESLRPTNNTGVHGLLLAGDWTATAVPCSMESAARSGALAAEAVAQGLGRTLRVAKPAPETTGLVALLRER
jgi:uncharacterized protein with NAD-binding domain and iron-sulfur cluster